MVVAGVRLLFICVLFVERNLIANIDDVISKQSDCKTLDRFLASWFSLYVPQNFENSFLGCTSDLSLVTSIFGNKRNNVHERNEKELITKEIRLEEHKTKNHQSHSFQ